ncbi:MAG: hypothetical protein KC931_19280, partial [Candidatus Omnitrophica bacterium]|nr:hypothetical protein [Candidatus Omnitrophota bacterium]
MPTPTLSQLYRTALLVFILIPLSANAENVREEFRLFPGESYTSMGVTVSWEVASATAEGSGPKNLLDFKGPNSEIRDVAVYPKDPNVSLYMRPAYLDDVVISYRPDSIHGPSGDLKIKSIECESKVYSSSVAVLHQMDSSVFVSHVNPFQVNHLKFTVSSEKVPYPDGSEYLEIVATDTISGETESLPAAMGARKSIGRFSFLVTTFNEEANTVQLRITAEPDLSIKGKHAWVEPNAPIGGDTLREVLEKIGDRYGVEIEWRTYEGIEESIDYAKNVEIKSILPAGSTLEEYIEGNLQHGVMRGDLDRFVTLEWK